MAKASANTRFLLQANMHFHNNEQYSDFIGGGLVCHFSLQTAKFELQGLNIVS